MEETKSRPPVALGMDRRSPNDCRFSKCFIDLFAIVQKICRSMPIPLPLYKHTPDSCRLIMIDPKMLELSVYDGIPHFLTILQLTLESNYGT